MEGFEFSSQFTSENEGEEIVQSPTKQASDSSTSQVVEVLGNAKERISGYLKYKGLKVKEYFGRLNQEDFDELLDFDFQEQLKDTPAIEGVFSPEEELAKIKSLPKEQKREALATFKENLARQREALAACRVFIERTIEFNHNAPRENLVTLTEKFATHYGFNDRQIQITEQLIDRYLENRQNALEIRQRFADDHVLVYELTGVDLDRRQNIKVSVGPMTIDIETDGFNSGRLYEKAYWPTIAFKYGGFASQSVGDNPVNYIVINQDNWIRWIASLDPSGKATRVHEYEHQKNKLFREVFENQEAPGKLVGYATEQDLEVKRIILEDFFKARRTKALERVKDEITACLHDRTLTQLQHELSYLFFEQKNDPYDYLGYLRSWKQFKDDTLYQEIAQRMLIQEYRAIVECAVDSYAELVNKGQCSTQEATALLTDKQLENWPKTIRGFLKAKE